MKKTISVSDEGLAELHELLEQELIESRTEYRHTRSHDYRDKIKHRISVTRDLLEAVEHPEQ